MEKLKEIAVDLGDELLTAAKRWASSTKAQAAIVALVVALASRFGFNLDAGTVATVISPLLLYILGQGMADLGKEAAAVQAAEKVLSGSRPVLVKSSNQSAHAGDYERTDS